MYRFKFKFRLITLVIGLHFFCYYNNLKLMCVSRSFILILKYRTLIVAETSELSSNAGITGFNLVNLSIFYTNNFNPLVKFQNLN